MPVINRDHMAFTVDKELAEKFRALSRRTRIPMSRLLDEAIEDLLTKHDARHSLDRREKGER